MASRQNGQLMKCQVDKMASEHISKWTCTQVDELASQLIDKLMKCHGTSKTQTKAG